MNIAEFHTYFKISLDKIDSNAYPNILSSEIDFFLNKAQDNFVTQVYDGNYKQSDQAFEETQKRKSDVQNLVAFFNRNVATTDYNKFNAVASTYQIPFTEVPYYMFKLNEALIVEDTNCKCPPCISTLPIVEYKLDQQFVIKRDPFNSPNLFNPITFHSTFVSLDLGGSINLSKYNLTYSLQYLKYPIRMSKATNTTCELLVHTHREIADLAVNLALETIESPRFQTNLIPLKETE